MKSIEARESRYAGTGSVRARLEIGSCWLSSSPAATLPPADVDSAAATASRAVFAATEPVESALAADSTGANFRGAAPAAAAAAAAAVEGVVVGVVVAAASSGDDAAGVVKTAEVDADSPPVDDPDDGALASGALGTGTGAAAVLPPFAAVGAPARAVEGIERYRDARKRGSILSASGGGRRRGSPPPPTPPPPPVVAAEAMLRRGSVDVARRGSVDIERRGSVDF